MPLGKSETPICSAWTPWRCWLSDRPASRRYRGSWPIRLYSFISTGFIEGVDELFRIVRGGNGDGRIEGQAAGDFLIHEQLVDFLFYGFARVTAYINTMAESSMSWRARWLLTVKGLSQRTMCDVLS